jgi:hypothetical protein
VRLFPGRVSDEFGLDVNLGGVGGDLANTTLGLIQRMGEDVDGQRVDELDRRRDDPMAIGFRDRAETENGLDVG